MNVLLIGMVAQVIVDSKSFKLPEGLKDRVILHVAGTSQELVDVLQAGHDIRTVVFVDQIGQNSGGGSHQATIDAMALVSEKVSAAAMTIASTGNTIVNLQLKGKGCKEIFSRGELLKYFEEIQV